MACIFYPSNPKKLSTNPPVDSRLWRTLSISKPLITLSFLKDLENPKTNTKNAGFTKEERQGFTELLEKGFIDSFRHFYPDKPKQYSFWSYMRNARAKNVGW